MKEYGASERASEKTCYYIYLYYMGLSHASYYITYVYPMPRYVCYIPIS